MIISHSKNFIFIHFEKCGGTSVETALQTQLSTKDIIIGSTDIGESIQNNYFSEHGSRYTKNNMLWKHSTARQIYRHVGRNNWKNYKKLSVVRDPIELAKSLFSFSEKVIVYHTNNKSIKVWDEMVKRNSFPDRWPYHEEYIQSYIRSKVFSTKFDGFVKDMVYRDVDCFSPYSERLKPSYFDSGFGKVIDLSQLNNRWSEICDYLEVTQPPIQKLNTSDSRSLNISESIRDVIRERFAVDYQVMPEYTGVTWN